jgi:hypothetical protein
VLKIGELYVPLSKKLEQVPVPLKAAFQEDGNLKKWATDANISPFHRYIRCLWSSLRLNRDKMVEIGLKQQTAYEVFEHGGLDAFRNTVDTIFSCMYPAPYQLWSESN